ncbi:IS3 family transposase [Streptomyces sp. NBC_00048]
MFGIRLICQVLAASRSGYYRWIAGAEARAERQLEEDALVEEIREIHAEHHGNYGALRVHAELRGFGSHGHPQAGGQADAQARSLRPSPAEEEAHYDPGPPCAAGARPGSAGLHRPYAGREGVRRHHIRTGRSRVALPLLCHRHPLPPGIRMVDGPCTCGPSSSSVHSQPR